MVLQTLTMQVPLLVAEAAAHAFATTTHRKARVGTPTDLHTLLYTLER